MAKVKDDEIEKIEIVDLLQGLASMTRIITLLGEDLADSRSFQDIDQHDVANMMRAFGNHLSVIADRVQMLNVLPTQAEK